MLDDRVFGQPHHPDAVVRAGRLPMSLDQALAATGIQVWHEIRDGAHARSRQAFRPVQSLHESSLGSVASGTLCLQSVATAKREFGRFVLARLAALGVDELGFGMEACA